MVANWLCAKCTKSSINQMVKCAKKLINLLTKWANMLKGCLHQGGKSFGGLIWACITSIFSFPTHTRAHFAQKLQKDYKMFSMWLQIKTKLKHRTHYAIFQNRRICVDRPAIWIGALCGLCILPIYKWLGGCAYWYSSSSFLYNLGLLGLFLRRRSESERDKCV